MTVQLTTYDSPYLSYRMGDAYSGFTLYSDDFVQKVAELIPDLSKREAFLKKEKIDVDEQVFSAMRVLWHQKRYKRYKDVYVPREADNKTVALLYKGYRDRIPVMLEYKEGYEMYPFDNACSCVSDNGLFHVAYIGKSTGSMPVLLHLENRSSQGGMEFMFSGLEKVSLVGECAA